MGLFFKSNYLNSGGLEIFLGDLTPFHENVKFALSIKQSEVNLYQFLLQESDTSERVWAQEKVQIALKRARSERKSVNSGILSSNFTLHWPLNPG